MSVAAELGYSFKSEKCYNPRTIVNRETGEIIPVTCNRCLPCLRRRQSEWIVRLREQLSQSFSAYFITLTYADEYVPTDMTGRNVLDRRDPSAFIARCRSLIQKGGFIWHDPLGNVPDQQVHLLRSPFKYYLTSEYGPETFRPHFHMVAFNLDPDPWKVDLLLNKAWPYGFTSSYAYNGDFMGFIGYVTKYLVNNLLCPSPDLPKPFSKMSKGLGWSYVERMEEWHKNDQNRRFSIYEDHKDILPRYWRDSLYTPQQRALQAKKIREALDKRAKDLDSALGDDEDLRKRFYSERHKYQEDQMYINLQHMLRKQKIK